MPELPEVEVVRRGVHSAAVGRTVREVVARVPKLRWPIPADLRERLAGHAIRAAERRGKYLLLAFDHGWLIVHLGMSGSLAVASPGAAPRTHDHLDLVLDDGAVLRLHDPRRFGAVLWHGREDGPIESHPLLARLGVEPFSEAFSAELLHAATRGRTASVKQALLAGDVVVGVGNIYASEALFRAGIRPTTRAGRVRLPRWRRLADAIRATLTEAIDKGGSSLRDFVGAQGESGHFQRDCYVYDRAGEPCRVCGTPIRAIRQQQRSTYYCPACQH